MSNRDEMPDNPGSPDATDPEATSAAQAEAAADAAEATQQETGQPSGGAGAEGLADDVAVEPEVDEVEEPISTAEDEAAEAETPEQALQRELDERTDDLKRLNAEYTNYRRRSDRERQSVSESAKASVLSALLPILDDLELAKQHGDLEEGSPLEKFGSKFRETLKGQNLVTFGEPGEAFDPEIHEAVQDLSSGGEQVVGTVLRKGYKVGDRLVRNAMVIIADPEGAQSSADESAQADDNQ
ncbi:nucleotide exchange factor GrpE [Corynebacterium pseudodiphtheriticum]|uniref:nucleotide exchange factor GrpE n=1 Tax=Corynebacterium pseudodiphtheriticum TaxID=37637 RepID=UPI000F88E5B8|nr:nucleotide exchange factor GrpE [Corynebacterium pseudodiphtheriticum]MDK8478349.1 nucleotide exchange factor GrpE [Corynebacterium pseudodiphtheriticum]MDK8486800.1 nucleotide exchange factor GrpE [Corynebacterium pseudodiphtheriticum]MDK8494188.1 nucleotide exchange factor GrpE [Corynebacterium pseudodiphtheriticum]MDK8614824.1 nucleotide exchange factor GrpE [Corynebacterium pseudodiphtheriticum]MDK8718568.1 nucleotide exchange factor GrpE [Corynebacterium pseudodiphtheriticum]